VSHDFEISLALNCNLPRFASKKSRRDKHLDAQSNRRDKFHGFHPNKYNITTTKCKAYLQFVHQLNNEMKKIKKW
jgi:hypothetical protein